MNCEQRIGFSPSTRAGPKGADGYYPSKPGKPILCDAPATVRLVNRKGVNRLYCDPHLKEYRDIWGMSMGTAEAELSWDQNFSVEQVGNTPTVLGPGPPE